MSTANEQPDMPEPPPSETKTPPIFHLGDLSTQFIPGISRAAGEYYAEAASVCLEECGHAQGVTLKVNGIADETYQLHWNEISRQAFLSHADPQYATEQGAYGVAALLICRITEHTVVERSFKGTGFDWWLGHAQDDFPFQHKARLEVSGIRIGTMSQIQARLRTKIAQPAPSDGTMLPAFAVVVEYSRPLVMVRQR